MFPLIACPAVFVVHAAWRVARELSNRHAPCGGAASSLYVVPYFV